MKIAARMFLLGIVTVLLAAPLPAQAALKTPYFRFLVVKKIHEPARSAGTDSQKRPLCDDEDWVLVLSQQTGGLLPWTRGPARTGRMYVSATKWRITKPGQKLVVWSFDKIATSVGNWSDPPVYCGR